MSGRSLYRLRIVLGGLFAWSLATTAALIGEIYFVRLPVLSPLFVHNARFPLGQLIPAFLAVITVVTVAAARWSATSNPVENTPQSPPRDRRTYYHGSRMLALLLAIATLIEWVSRVDLPYYVWACFHRSRDFWVLLGEWVYALFQPFPVKLCCSGQPVFPALIVVAFTVVFRRRAIAGDSELVPCLPALAPGRFLFAWAASLILAVFAAMAITMWGSTIIFNIEPRYWYYWLFFPCAVSLIVAAVAIVDDYCRERTGRC